MSGQAAIRGFAYQTIVSVIQSLTRNDWAFVTVEPDTDQEKVDIIWELLDGSIRCQQVKSSINNFSKVEIERWLAQMKSDVSNAIMYELLLIGNISTGTNSFVNKSKKQPGIDIEVIVNNLEFLDSRVRDEVSRFLSGQDFHLPHNTIVMISGGLLYQFLSFSVVGLRVSKQEFTDHFLNWVKSNYSKDLGIKPNKSQFSVSFYDRPNRTFSNKIQAAPVLTEDAEILKDQAHLVYTKYSEAANIRLSHRTKREDDLQNSVFPPLISLTELSESEPLTSEKIKITQTLEENFNIKVSDSFFYVGNVMIDRSRLLQPFHGGIQYAGTTDEVLKMETLDSLRWEIDTFLELKKFFDYLNQCRQITLVLENSGSYFDEEISVTLKIPFQIQVALPDNLEVPDELDALEKLIDDQFVSKLFKISKDSLVTGFEYVPWVDFDPQGISELLYKMHGYSKKLELKKDRFMHIIEAIFEVEIFHDLPGFLQYRFHFKKVNPNIKMAFPFHMLVQATSDFKIDYEIRTKNSPTVHNGELYCFWAETLQKQE